jgi:hypothetical protein
MAIEINERPNTIIPGRDRFIKYGMEGLKDQRRSGKPITYGNEFKKLVLDKLTETPPDGLAHWDGPTLAKELSTSVYAIWRLLEKEGIHLVRQRTWCVSRDPEFTAKAADIVGLYTNPPENKPPV